MHTSHEVFYAWRLEETCRVGVLTFHHTELGHRNDFSRIGTTHLPRTAELSCQLPYVNLNIAFFWEWGFYSPVTVSIIMGLNECLR